MIQLGERQELTIVKKVDFGVYLAVEEGAREKVLLPIRQVPEGSALGDKLEVFIYRDSEDRLIATVRQPKLMLGQVADLTVVQMGKFGAFLDWGLERDLFLPFREQRGKVQTGKNVLVTLYIDKSDRLCATMNVYEVLRADSPYKAQDKVRGRVYEINDNLGAFVAVDNLYYGLIAPRELYGDVRLGEDVVARILKVREDGKLDLSVREKAWLQMDVDAEKILKLLESHGGELPLSDKSSPELIKRGTGMSKKEFKRAVGRLFKQRKIEIGEGSIRLNS